MTILFTEHDMEVVFDMARKMAVMHEGSFFAEGLPDEMRSDKGVQEIYFGEPPMLSVSGVHTYYGAAHTLFDISLQVAQGEAVGLVGRNGVGKTTEKQPRWEAEWRAAAHAHLRADACHESRNGAGRRAHGGPFAGSGQVSHGDHIGIEGEGFTMLISAPDLRFALRVADRIHVMSRGRIVYAGTNEDVRREEATIKKNLFVV